MPKFSIVIPVYNAEKYLKEAIDSVINQTFKDFELLLIDDGSTDNSNLICENYAKKDDRIKIIRNKNQGVGATRNCGVNNATGEYLLFLDSDDWFELDALEKINENVCRTKSDLCFFDARSVFVDCNNDMNKVLLIASAIDKQPFKLLDLVSCVTNVSRETWYKAYKREFLIKNNVKCLKIQRWEDTYFWTKLIVANPLTSMINECLYNYRYVENSLTKTIEKSLKHLFYVFNSSNGIILNSDIDEKIKVHLVKANIVWFDNWCKRAKKVSRFKTNNLKKREFKKLKLRLKKQGLLEQFDDFGYVLNYDSKEYKKERIKYFFDQFLHHI